MEKWTDRWKAPAHPGVDRTLVELLGRSRLLVEHHRGIVGYGPEEILISTEDGLLEIRGQELRLCCMSREQLVICGEIQGLRLEGGGR